MKYIVAIITKRIKKNKSIDEFGDILYRKSLNSIAKSRFGEHAKKNKIQL